MRLRAPLLLLALAGQSLQQSTNATTPTNQTILNNIISIAAKGTNCANCFNILEALKQPARLGLPTLTSVGTSLCTLLGAGSPLECAGLQALEAPSVQYAILNLQNGSRSAQVFCEALLGFCPQPAVLPYNVTIPKPKPANLTRPGVSGKTPIKVVHLSDLHVDSGYTVGASYNCSEAVCCRAPETVIGMNGSYPAGPFGEYYCDSPRTLEQAQYAAIQRLVPERAFTIVTGDMVEGASWQTTQQKVINDLTDLYTLMESSLGQVYPAIGNHDANPVNSFPPAGVKAGPYNNTYDYNLHAKLWSPWLDKHALNQVAHNRATYTTKHCDTKLRFISINTMFWEGVNWWIYNSTMSRDPSGIFRFMANALQEAEDCGERVWIIGHIPPGRNDCLYDYSSYFDQLVQRYSDTIAALFWGHTHQDQFEISYRNFSSQTFNGANSIGYIAPSLTPTSGNPNFRVYEVDPETFAILDYTVYIANISDPTYQTSGPDFVPYYSAKSAYGTLVDPPLTDPAAELSPAFWHNVTVAFEGNDTAFQEYYARKGRGFNVKSCNGKCKSTELCQLRSSQSQYGCVASSGVLKRRGLDFGEEEEQPACTTSIWRKTMRKLGRQ